jgi:cytochrome P450
MYKAQCYLLSNPLPLALLFAFVRRARPVAVVGSLVVVTKARDVRELLYRLADFTTADDLGPKIPWGPFMVVIDWPEQHKRERDFLQSVVNKYGGDVDQIRGEAAKICRARINQACKCGRIDVVKQLCDPVVIDIIESYFGIPSGGLSADEMARLLGRIAGFILVEPPAGSAIRMQSLDSIATLTSLIVGRITGKIPAPKTVGNPDLLTRLLTRNPNTPAWVDADWIRRYITGLAVFGGGTIIRATAQAIDQLLEHPADLQAAQALAQEIEADTLECERLKAAGAPSQHVQDRIIAARGKLLQIIYEALRFRPMLPLLSRYVPRETIIAKDTSYARMAPAGATALAPPIAAMFDPEEFPHPWRFDRTRCLKKYVHFGHGPRECFGKYVADVLMIEIFRALLLCKDLKRAGGAAGRIAYEGPAVSSLTLTLGVEKVPS